MLHIRVVVPEDLGALADLTKQLGYDTSLATLRANILSYLQDNERSLFVAVVENTVVGYIATGVTQMFHQEKKHMRVVSLVVDRLHRGKGIGKRLLLAAEDWAREHNCWMIDLTSSFRRETEGTHDFYLNQGYRKDGSAYFRKLMDHS
jgi:GNAT superfamily N-acetyltransferase